MDPQPPNQGLTGISPDMSAPPNQQPNIAQPLPEQAASVPTQIVQPQTQQLSTQPIQPPAVPGHVGEPLPSVDTSHLFMPDNPYAKEAPIDLPPNTDMSQPKPSKKKFVVVPFVLLLLVGLGFIGARIFGANRGANSSVADSSDYSESLNSISSASTEAEGAPTSSKSGSSSKKSSSKKSSGSSGTSSASSSSSTSSSDSSSTSSGSSKKSTSSSTSSKTTTTAVSKVTDNTTSAPAKAAGVPASIPKVVSCTKDSKYSDTIAPEVLSQISASINAALAGKAGSLTSWLDAKYRSTAAISDPSAVNKSFADVDPAKCTVLPVIFADATNYRTQGISFFVQLPEAKGQLFFNSVNLALVNGVWKTEDITTARHN